MSWPQGISWTKGRWETTVMPDGTTKELYLQCGLFYFNPSIFGIVYFYIGFRPTPPWAEGYGDEGLFGSVARWMKRHGFGNLGIALRRAKADA